MLIRSIKFVFWVVGMAFLAAWLTPLQAVTLEKDNTVIIPDKVEKTVKIDGKLDEAVWKHSPINKPFITFSPQYGDPLGEITHVWAAYDKKNLYFAFKCFDSQPGQVKTSISRRDNISQDDQVAIQLDATGSKQTSYEFRVNPNGIQADYVYSSVSVDGADKSPDFVWDSAGMLTPDGYQVEVRIPLKSIRYQAGETVKMGVIFTRFISRLGTKASWPETKAGQTYFNFMANLQYSNLKSGLKLEILPNFTYSSTKERLTPDEWETASDTNIGVGIKYGITSSMTAEVTVNPDFSQVESDSFQVEVNQRYPIFYSEKRPFFMESKEVLDFGVVKWGTMPAPIHTRTIVDPSWAAKYSGSTGKMNFALLAANDRSPGRALASGTNPNEGKSALFGIFRAKYNIGGDNSVGILYSGRHFAGGSNNVFGADLKYRLSKSLRASFSYLHSSTRENEDDPFDTGGSVNAMLQYNTAKFFSMLAYERYDVGFYMASAFLNRTGITKYTLGLGPRFNTKIKKMSWLKGITPYTYLMSTHDLETKMDDNVALFGVTINLAPMGELNFEYYIEREAWVGQNFDKNYFVGIGQIQLFKWLFLNSSFIIGDSIYYDTVSPFLGDGVTFTAGTTIQPNPNLNIGFDYQYTDLKSKDTGEKAYAVNIYNFRTTYQFNKYFFVRGILRYDDYQQKLLTDFLASFTLIPGTVVHFGYGSLYLKREWEPNQKYWIAGVGDMTVMSRSIFFKASYLWRFK